jgi:predicted metal-binding membrane protein
MQSRSDLTGAVAPPATPAIPTAIAALSVAAGVAWLAAIAAELTGTGPLLHHHSLIEGGADGAPPLLVAAALALVSWQVMVAGMMVPASLPAIRVFEHASRSLARPTLAVAGFIAAFALGWGIVGLVAFSGDFVLHQIVDATPWLEEHAWVVQAGTFALAGAYQLTPFKHRFLAACRHPMAVGAADPDGPRTHSGGLVGVRAGWAHAIDCIGASGPLMLLMFAAGFANLAWMAALTSVMVYEARGRAGHRAAVVVGVALLVLSLVAVALGGIPGFEPPAA